MAIQLTAEDKRKAQEAAAFTAAANASWDAYAADKLDPNSPNYVGPGYEDQGKTDRDGNRILTLTNKPVNDAWKLTRAAPAPQNPQANTGDLIAQAEQMAGLGAPAAPVAPRTTADALKGAAPMAGQPTVAGGITRGAGTRVATATVRDPVGQAAQGFGGAPPAAPPAPAVPSGTDTSPYTEPGAEAPKVDRAAVNAALAPVNQIGGMLTAEALRNSSAGLAEAQLRESTARAREAALGQARSGNRRDRVQLERQAIGEGTFLEQEAGRQAATLRANEELQNRQFKVDTLAKAGELGLNVAAYEVDLSKANLASANNWITQQFEQLGLDKQLNTQMLLEKMGLAEQRYATDTQAGLQAQQLQEQRFQNLLGFTRDMAAIQLQYDQLSVADQNEADALMMQRYGIDQQTMVALKQIKEAGRFKWDQVLAGMAGGAGMGATGLAGKYLIDGGPK